MRTLYFQGGATATGNGTEIGIEDAESIAIQVEGITTATVAFEVSIDGTTWYALAMTPSAGGAAVTSATADGLFQADVRGYAEIRARISAYTSGTITVTGGV